MSALGPRARGRSVDFIVEHDGTLEPCRTWRRRAGSTR